MPSNTSPESLWCTTFGTLKKKDVGRLPILVVAVQVKNWAHLRHSQDLVFWLASTSDITPDFSLTTSCYDLRNLVAVANMEVQLRDLSHVFKTQTIMHLKLALPVAGNCPVRPFCHTNDVQEAWPEILGSAFLHFTWSSALHGATQPHCPGSIAMPLVVITLMTLLLPVAAPGETAVLKPFVPGQV